jgi:hypothetical protein
MTTPTTPETKHDEAHPEPQQAPSFVSPPGEMVVRQAGCG